MPPKRSAAPVLAPTTIARVIEKKARGHEETVLLPSWTAEDPVDLLVEKGAEPRISEQKIGEIATYGSRMLEAKTEAATAKKRYDESEIAVRGLFGRYKGLRGISFAEHGFKMNAVRRDSLKWNPKELRSIFGKAYSSVFSETGIINVNISPEVRSKKGTLSAERVYEVIRQSLKKEGMDDSTIDKTVSYAVDVSADYKKLNALVKERKVRLSKKAAKITSSLAVTVEPFNSDTDGA